MLRLYGPGMRITTSWNAVILTILLLGAIGFCFPSLARGLSDQSSYGGRLGVQNLHTIGMAMADIDGAENILLLKGLDEARRRHTYLQFDAARKSLDEARGTYENLSRSAEEARIWKQFILALARWTRDHERFIQLAKAYEKINTPEAYNNMLAQALDMNPSSLSTCRALLNETIKANLKQMEESGQHAGGAASLCQESIVGMIVWGAVIVAAITILLWSGMLSRRSAYGKYGGRRLILDVGKYPPVFPSTRSQGKDMSKKA